MPTTTSIDHDDPVVTSYTVYLTTTPPAATTPCTDSPAPSHPRLFVLQYPSHRPASRPYNNPFQQKPRTLRHKSRTGLLEVEIPIDTSEHFNRGRGRLYAKSLQQSRIAQKSGSHGLAGGFNTSYGGSRYPRDINLRDLPAEVSGKDSRDIILETQTMGGKIVEPVLGDPVYMIGSFRSGQLHLSHLDALVQMRPQLHHLDAMDEVDRMQSAAAAGGARGINGISTGPDILEPKAESKAVNLKYKDKDDDDINLKDNARLVRAIQAELWQTYQWIDESTVSTQGLKEARMHVFPQAETRAGDLPDDVELPEDNIPSLKSPMSNLEWLDKMSAPRITEQGKKGLMGKVKAREREKARRRQNDRQKRERNREVHELAGLMEVEPAAGEHTANESDRETGSSSLILLSSADDTSSATEDVEVTGTRSVKRTNTAPAGTKQSSSTLRRSGRRQSITVDD